MKLSPYLVKIGTALATVGGGMLAADSDKTRTIYWQFLLLVGGALIAWGADNHATNLTAAMAKPVEVVSATPAARLTLMSAPTPVVPAPLTDAQRAQAEAEYRAAHPVI